MRTTPEYMWVQDNTPRTNNGMESFDERLMDLAFRGYCTYSRIWRRNAELYATHGEWRRKYRSHGEYREVYDVRKMCPYTMMDYVRKGRDDKVSRRSLLAAHQFVGSCYTAAPRAEVEHWTQPRCVTTPLAGEIAPLFIMPRAAIREAAICSVCCGAFYGYG